jgi:hypothetical protein
MDIYAMAHRIYREGMRVLAASRDRAVVNDELRWAREDLEDVLLDVKLAVLSRDERTLGVRSLEAVELIGVVFELAMDTDDPPGSVDG